LGIVIFKSCSQGAFVAEWQKKLGTDVKMVGWDNPVLIEEIGMINRGEGKYKTCKVLNE